MKPRQTVESYWSVWIFNDQRSPGFWEPFNEGMTTKAAAVADMCAEQRRNMHERFAIVRTINTRIAGPRQSPARTEGKER